MKAVIRGNEKAVIKVHVGKKISWQYKATPEAGSPVTAAKIVEFINTLNGDAQTEEWVVELQAQLAGKTIEQLIFDTHQMEEILAEILESTDDKDTKEEIMFLQDLYASIMILYHFYTDSAMSLCKSPAVHLFAIHKVIQFTKHYHIY